MTGYIKSCTTGFVFLVVAILFSGCASTNLGVDVSKLTHSDLRDISNGYMCYNSPSCVRAGVILKVATKEFSPEEREVLFKNFTKTVRAAMISDMEKMKLASEYLGSKKSSPITKKALEWHGKLERMSTSGIKDEAEEALAKVKAKRDFYHSLLGHRGVTEFKTLAKTARGIVKLVKFLDDHPYFAG